MNHFCVFYYFESIPFSVENIEVAPSFRLTLIDGHEAPRSVFTYIEIFYIGARIHSGLGALSPIEYEEMNGFA
jgi:hypothetical protein